MSLEFKRVKGDANHHLYKRGDIYWVRFRKAGKAPLQESLDTENVTDARIRRDEAIASYLGTRARHQGAYLIGDKFPEWIEMNAPRWSLSTRTSVSLQWDKHLSPYFGNLLLDDANETRWLGYVSKKRETDLNRKFFNDRKYLGMFLNWCLREGFIEKLPRLPDVDPEIKAGKALTDDEVDALLLNADMDLHLQIILAVKHGMRSSEILFLEFTQVDFERQTIHLPAEKTKIRKARTFKVSAEAIALIKTRRSKSTSPWVFPSRLDQTKSVKKNGNKSAWTTCRTNAKVKCRFHDLRHTFLTRAFRTSTNPALICFYAGVSLEEAQRTYLHFTVDDTSQIAELVKVDR